MVFFTLNVFVKGDIWLIVFVNSFDNLYAGAFRQFKSAVRLVRFVYFYKAFYGRGRWFKFMYFQLEFVG